MVRNCCEICTMCFQNLQDLVVTGNVDHAFSFARDNIDISSFLQ